MTIDQVKFDCKYFKGVMPCSPNKKYDVTCDNCDHYVPISKRILIIKLGAIGDVIRTTPLIVKYKEMYPNAHFTWLTLFPNVLPDQEIDLIYTPDAVALFNITHQEYDIALNLDKDEEACKLLSAVKATEKYGFTFENQRLSPATPKAEHKIITGLFDGISKVNTKSYLEEIFEICHLDFNKEEYLIKTNSTLIDKWKTILAEKSEGKIVVGLNTGCGERWKTRLWPQENWISFIKQLKELGFYPMLLGGKQEDEVNQYYADQTGAFYPGYFSLEEFISLSSATDIIVTQVSMMMHIAMALKKQLVLFNNIFNAHEFEMYNRGVIIQPSSGCDCYFGNSCCRETSCMFDIKVDRVIDHVKEIKEKL